MLVTFCVKNIVSFCVKKLLHFALKSCYILRQKLLHFGLMLHFVSKVVTFRVNVTFCVNCYILRRNRPYLGCIAEMAPDDRKIKCTTRLGALDVPRSSAHKAKEFVGFCTLFSHLFVRGKIA